MIFLMVVVFALVFGCADLPGLVESEGSKPKSSKNSLWKFETDWEAKKPAVYENKVYVSAGNLRLCSYFFGVGQMD